MMGGAALLDPNKKGITEELEKARIFGLVNGRLTNCHSAKDYVLKYIFMGHICKQVPIGLKPIFESVTEGEQAKHKLKKAENFDCTKEAKGHMKYQPAYGIILKKMGAY